MIPLEKLRTDPRVAMLCNALRHAHSALVFGASDTAEVAKTCELALAQVMPPSEPTEPTLPSQRGTP